MSYIAELNPNWRRFLEAEVSRRVYTAKLTRLTRQVGKLEGSALKRLLSLLKELQSEIRRELSETPEERFRAEHLRSLLAVVNDMISDYSVRLQSVMNKELERFYHRGSNDFDEMLEVQGIKAPMFGLPRDVLEIAQGFSADLISGITDDLRNRINRILRLGILRGDSPFKIMREIGARIDRGPFKTVAQRAETVARTELLRIYSLGHWARMQSTAEYIPSLRKRWVSSRDPRVRPSHAKADGQTVPWDKPFIIGGHKAMYPRDPRLPPEESINCRCLMIPVITEEELERLSPTTMITPEVRREIAEPTLLEKLGVSERTFKRKGEAEVFTEGSALEGFRMQLLRKQDEEGEFIEVNFKISRESFMRISKRLRKTSVFELEERGWKTGTMWFERFQKEGGKFIKIPESPPYGIPSFVKKTEYYTFEIPIGQPLRYRGVELYHAGDRTLDGFLRLRVRGGFRDVEKALREIQRELKLPNLLRPPSRRDLEKAKRLRLLWQEDPTGWWELGGYHPTKVSFKKLDAYFEAHPELKEKLDRMELLDLKGYKTFVVRGREAELRKAGALGFFHEMNNPFDLPSIVESDFLSSFERLKRGIISQGKSPFADIRSGGADQIFFRLLTEDTKYSPFHTLYVLYDLKPLERTDWWIYPRDLYGTVRETQFFERQPVIEVIQELARKWRPDNEIMMRSRVLSKEIKAVMVRKGDLDRVKDALKEAGIERIGGRPLEEVLKEYESWEDFKEALK